jgi:hypothetical protein
VTLHNPNPCESPGCTTRGSQVLITMGGPRWLCGQCYEYAIAVPAERRRWRPFTWWMRP